MVLLFSIKHKVFSEQSFPFLEDPLGGNEGVVLYVMQRYISSFEIPYAGTRKLCRAFSTGTNQPIPVLLWTDNMLYEANRMMIQTTGAWKNRIVGQVLLMSVIGLIAYMIAVVKMDQRDQSIQEEYTLNPKPGDIILSTVIPGKDNRDFHLAIIKIEEIHGDSLIIRRGIQRMDTNLQYQTDKKKLTDLFDSGENAFTKEREVFSLSKYREGSERLQRFTVNLGDIDDIVERKRLDSIYRNADIIEPQYIKRIKK